MMSPNTVNAPASHQKSEPTSRWRTDRLIAVWIVLALLAVFQLNLGFTPGNDAKGTIYTAATLLAKGRVTFTPETEPFMFLWQVDTPSGPRQGSLVDWTSPVAGVSPRELLSRGALRLEGPKYYIAPSRAGGYVNAFGLAPSLAALPVFGVLSLVLGDLRLHPVALWYGGKFAASLFVAMAVALSFLSARRLGAGQRVALIVASVHGLGTCAWAVLSQTLWQQAPAGFFLALGVAAFVSTDGQARSRPLALAGAAFGLATACRATSVVVLVVVGLHLALKHRRDVIPFVAGAFAPVVAWMAVNTWQFGTPWTVGQLIDARPLAVLRTGSPQVFRLPFEGLAGLLVSPGRGMLVFSPVLGFALWGWLRAWRRPDAEALRILSLAGGAVALLEATHFDWWGGWTYGYRRIADIIPLLVPGLVPALALVTKSLVRRVAFGLALAYSVFVQALGAFAYDLDGWNARVVDGVARDVDRPEFRRRLWSISDSPILYYATHWTEARKRRAAWIDNWLRRPTA